MDVNTFSLIYCPNKHLEDFLSGENALFHFLRREFFILTGIYGANPYLGGVAGNRWMWAGKHG